VQEADKIDTKTDSLELIDISIDQALSYIGKVPDLEFMREVQRMKFKVSPLRLKNCIGSRLQSA